MMTKIIRKLDSCLLITGLVVALAAPWALAGSGQNIRYYELYLSPNADGQNNPTSSWGGVPQPMGSWGDGYGNDDYDSATMGLQHDGTARFVDSGAHGIDGFWAELPGDDAVDMEIKVHSNCLPSTTGHTFEMLANDDYGVCIAADTNQIRLVNLNGTYTSAAIDLTMWQKIRLAMTNDHPTSGEDLPPVATSGEDTWVKIYKDEGSGWVSLIDWTQVVDRHTSAGPGLPLESDVRKAVGPYGSTAKFVLHCSNSYTTNSDFSAKYFRVSGGGFLAYGGARAMATPQGNLVYDDTCELMVNPLGTYSKTVAPGTARNVAYLVANTSNTTGAASHWTVTEVDAGGNPASYDWVSTNKAGGTITSNQTQNDPAASPVSEYVTVTLNGDGALPGGVYTAYLRFADDCPATPLMRRIDYTVDGCTWSFDPSGRIYTIPEQQGDKMRDYVITVANTGGAGYSAFSYTITECDGAKIPADMPWLSLSKLGGGPISPGGNDTVTATVDFTQISVGDNEANIKFANDCDPQDVYYVKIFGAFIFNYNGDMAPDTPGSCGGILTFVPFNTGGDPPEEAVVTPVSHPGQMQGTDDGFGWMMNDGPTGKKQYRTEPLCTIQEDPGTAGATMVVRMKSVFAFGAAGPPWSSTNVEEDFAIRENDGMSTGWHWSGAGDHLHEISNPPGWVREVSRAAGYQYFFTDQTDEWYEDWHILRLTVNREIDGSRHIQLYFDEDREPLIDIPDGVEKTASDNYDAFIFGTGSTVGQQSVFYDWITATNAGAFVPGDEVGVIGQRLCIDSHCPELITCNLDVFADSDEDGDVDQEDFSLLQICFTGTGPSNPPIPEDPWYCQCFDRRNDDGSPGDDGDIDSFDLRAFENCASGPDVAADPACDD